MFPRGVVLAEAAALFLLSVPGVSLGFVPPSSEFAAAAARRRVRPGAGTGAGASASLRPRMSYLDDLSRGGTPRPEDPEDGSSPGGMSRGAERRGGRSGGSSYLDNLAAGAGGSSSTGGTTEAGASRGGGGGGIPSGRGPRASYLDALAGGARGGDAAAAASDAEADSDPASVAGGATGSASEEGRSAAGTASYLDGGGGGEPAFLTGDDDSQTDVRNLLTQRAIQSFMYLLEECRDPHSAKWIQEDFLRAGNLLDFHGTGAAFLERFGGSWDAPLLSMIERPRDAVIVSARRRGRGRGGWSPNNPYLEDRYVEFRIDIDPASLASRILSVREQIAAEWAKDLDIVAEANGRILDSYFSGIRAGRDGGRMTGEAVGEMDVAFERTAVNILNNRTSFSSGPASSPFRKGNFDLLYNLCTQAAIHRILREDRAAAGEAEVPSLWLRDFYSERAAEYFDGDLPYGRADDFMDELLRSAPAVLKAGDGRTGLTDPLGTAERIVRTRDEVAGEWKEAMGRVPEDHTGIRRALLSRQMRGWGGVDASGEGGDGAEGGAFQ